jgi:hypothetical protein
MFCTYDDDVAVIATVHPVWIVVLLLSMPLVGIAVARPPGVNVSLPTLCEKFTRYVPVPPVPLQLGQSNDPFIPVMIVGIPHLLMVTPDPEIG